MAGVSVPPPASADESVSCGLVSAFSLLHFWALSTSPLWSFSVASSLVLGVDLLSPSATVSLSSFSVSLSSSFVFSRDASLSVDVLASVCGSPLYFSKASLNLPASAGACVCVGGGMCV